MKSLFSSLEFLHYTQCKKFEVPPYTQCKKLKVPTFLFIESYKTLTKRFQTKCRN